MSIIIIFSILKKKLYLIRNILFASQTAKWKNGYSPIFSPFNNNNFIYNCTYIEILQSYRRDEMREKRIKFKQLNYYIQRKGGKKLEKEKRDSETVRKKEK